MDEYYTPTDLAIALVELVATKRPKVIADFAAGGGELLLQAEKHWPSSEIIATDISAKTVNRLKRRFDHWIVGKCDFMSQKSRFSCKPIRQSERNISIAILNPPFTCRGGTVWTIRIGKKEIHCSLAAGFLLNALPYISIGGDIVAIVPLGSLTSEKDRIAWRVIRELASVTVSQVNDGKVFPRSSAKTAIVHISNIQHAEVRDEEPEVEKSSNTGSKQRVRIVLSRGTVQMSDYRKSNSKHALPLVHTTDLNLGRVSINGRRISEYTRAVNGPAVLLSRVGKPIKEKTALYRSGDPIVLSDCVVGLKARSGKEALIIKETLDKNWSTFEKHYVGTCARYITMLSIKKILISLGFLTVVEDSRPRQADEKSEGKKK